MKSFDDLPDKDICRQLPRLQPENFDVNLKLVKELETISVKKSCSPAQLALGWEVALSERPDMPAIIPIPGVTTADRVKENATVVEISGEGV